MAGAASDYHRGDQDIHAQEATFHAVMIVTKWGSLAIAAVVLLLALWFCTDAGFLSAFGAAFALVAVGIFFLRSSPSSH